MKVLIIRGFVAVGYLMAVTRVFFLMQCGLAVPLPERHGHIKDRAAIKRIGLFPEHTIMLMDPLGLAGAVALHIW
jgi:hypothetical protein